MLLSAGHTKRQQTAGLPLYCRNSCLLLLATCCCSVNENMFLFSETTVGEKRPIRYETVRFLSLIPKQRGSCFICHVHCCYWRCLFVLELFTLTSLTRIRLLYHVRKMSRIWRFLLVSLRRKKSYSDTTVVCFVWIFPRLTNCVEL